MAATADIFAPQVVGTPTIATSEPVEMLGPDGEVKLVQGRHAGTMSALGYQRVTPEIRQQLDDKARLGGTIGEMAAAGLGFARGSTLGLSDLAARGAENAGILPEGTTEDIRKLKEINPNASLAGELTSFITPGLGAIKALGTAGKVARGMGAAQAAVGGVGNALGKAAAKITGEQLGRYVAPAVRTAAEAAIFQAGQNISENVLANKELTAEAVLANTGEAAILGGGLGIGIPLALRGAQRAATAALDSAPAQWMATKSGKALAKFLDPQRAAQLYSGAMSKPSLFRDTIEGKGFRENVKHLWDEGFYKRGSVDFDEATGKIIQSAGGGVPSQEAMYQRLIAMRKSFGEAIGKATSEADDAVRVARGMAPGERLANEAIEKSAIPKAPKMTSLRDAWKKLVNDSGVDGWETGRADLKYEEWLGGFRNGKKPEAFEGGLLDHINERFNLTGSKRVSGAREAFEKLMDGSREWSKVESILDDLRQIPGLERLRLPDDISEQLMASAGDDFLFGANVEKAASATGWAKEDSEIISKQIAKWRTNREITEHQSELFNEVANDISAAVDASNGSLTALHDLRMGLDKRVGGENFKRFSDQDVELVKTIRGIVSKKIDAGMVELAGQGVVGKEAAEKWRRVNRTFGAIADVMPQLDWQVARAESNVNVGGLRWRDLLATATGSSMGGAAFGPVGAVVGGGLGLANRALQTDAGLLMRAELGERMASIGWLQKSTEAAEKNIARSVSGFLKGVDAAAIGGAVSSRPQLAGALAASDALTPDVRQGNDAQWFADTSGQIARVMADPESFAEEQGARLGAIVDHAPQTSDAIISKQLQIYSYLGEVMPKNPGRPTSILAPTWRPNEYQINEFRDVVRVARKPLSILQDLQHGTATRAQTKAIQALYPSLYEKMLEQVREQLAKPNASLPYEKELRLGVLFPGAVPSMTGAFILSMSTGKAEAEEPSTRSGYRAGGAGKMKVGTRNSTKVDALSER